MSGESASRLVVLGQVNGLHGVRGWVKVYSHTRPRENIFSYSPWELGGRLFKLEQGQLRGKGLIAKLEGVETRDQAADLLSLEIRVPRERLPPISKDEYYWTDLQGLRVINREGVELGRVDHLLETGANDVMVVRGERERLLPWVFDHVVLEVNLEQGLVRVDWDADF